jgi:transposase InsO family protein
MVLKEGDTAPGDCISCDHYISPVPGRVIAPSGYSSVRHSYQGGTIYVDHASGWIFHRPQKTLNVNDTICGKLLLESEARDVGVTIKAYHTDNGVFNCKEFKAHCTELNQKLTFSGVGAHHQNGVAERAIQTISGMARATMIHCTLKWPERGTRHSRPVASSNVLCHLGIQSITS